MKRSITIYGLVIAALVLAGCGQATTTLLPATPAPPRTISVSGEGKVKVTPDIALVSIGVITQDADISKAWDDNAAKMTAVFAALNAQGVKNEDISTNFNVYQQEKYDENGRPAGVFIFFVNNMAYITIRDIPKLGKILGDAQAAGANSYGGLTFTLEDPSRAMKDARAKALVDARAKADEVAQGLNIKVGKVLSVSTNGTSVPYPQTDISYAKGLGGGGGAVPVSPGTYEVDVTITVVFEIE